MEPHKNNNKSFYLFFGTVSYLFLLYIALRASTLQFLDNTMTFPNALMHIANAPFEDPFNIILSKTYTPTAILLITGFFIFMIFLVIIEAQRNHHDMAGKESGSAKWNTDIKGYNKKFSDPHGSIDNSGEKNVIFTDKISLSLESFKTRRNLNAVILGGSGAGKSRYFVKPNILQANCNYVITDPAGELLESTGEFLRQQGYEIKVFNLVEMQKSNCYNPFHYIRDDQGVLMMINCLIKNTNQDGQKGGDPFWEKSETALLQALCFYLIKYRPVEEQNFTTVMKLLRAAEVDENNPNHMSDLDRIFKKIEEEDPDSIALKQYRTFKMGAGKTLKSILISCSVRLTVFNLQQIENLTRVDNIHLEELGGTGNNKKQALFVIIPAADNTFNFLVSMMYSQLFETLYYVAETSCEKQRLPRHVRFLLDEFANIGQIPEFTNKLATMRKYEISCSIILQNLAQIKTMYKDDWETLIGNSDSFLFLGGKEYSTLEYISKELGNQTITVKDRSNSQGKSGSSSKSFKQTSRALMFPDELGNIEDDKCIFILRGVDPFFDKKYDYPRHPNYKYTGDASSKNRYVNTINNSITTYKDLTLDEALASAEYTPPEKTSSFDFGSPTPVSAEILNKLATGNTSAFFNQFVISTSQNEFDQSPPPAYIFANNHVNDTIDSMKTAQCRVLSNFGDLRKPEKKTTSSDFLTKVPNQTSSDNNLQPKTTVSDETTRPKQEDDAINDFFNVPTTPSFSSADNDKSTNNSSNDIIDDIFVNFNTDFNNSDNNTTSDETTDFASWFN